MTAPVDEAQVSNGVVVKHRNLMRRKHATLGKLNACLLYRYSTRSLSLPLDKTLTWCDQLVGTLRLEMRCEDVAVQDAECRGACASSELRVILTILNLLAPVATRNSGQ